MDDLDFVDDQHSHGKSVGKYHMVNRVKRNQSKVLKMGSNQIFIQRRFGIT